MSWKSRRRLTFAACSIAVLLAVPSALAQAGGVGSGKPNNEEVIVTAPRTYATGEHGAPIRTVSLKGTVRFDDLDLSTPWGKTELKARVRVMASNLCGDLERQYPVGVKGGPSCYEQALGQAMHLADQVEADAQYDYWKR